MNPDPNPNPNPSRDNPNNLLDTIILLGYNVRIGCCSRGKSLDECITMHDLHLPLYSFSPEKQNFLTLSSLFMFFTTVRYVFLSECPTNLQSYVPTC